MEKPKNHKKKWDHVEEATLCFHSKHKPVGEVAKFLGRTSNAVKVKAKALGVSIKKDPILKPNSWTEEEIRYLGEKAGNETSKEIAKAIGRTSNAVKVKATRLGLSLEKSPWTEEQTNLLYDLYEKGFSTRQMSEEIGRSIESVRVKMRGSMLSTNYIWSKEDIKLLLQYKSENRSWKVIEKELGRSQYSVRKKYYKTIKAIKDGKD